MFLSLLDVNVVNEPGRRWLRDLYRIHQRLWMAFADAKRRANDPFFLDSWDGPLIPEPKPKRREAGFLFRIERDRCPRILVQSAERPDWRWAFQNAPYLLAADPQMREFDPAPRRDQTYGFRLLANVVIRRSVAHPNGKTRTTRAGLTVARRRRTETLVHPTPLPDPLPVDPAERQRVLFARWDPWRTWLGGLSGRHGFRVVDEPRTPLLMEVVPTSVRNPGKGRGGSGQEEATERRHNGGLFEGRLVCVNPDQLRDAIVNGIGNAKAFGFGLLSVAPVR